MDTKPPLQSTRLNLRSWLALLSLGLALWFTINNVGLLGEVVGILFGAFLLSLAIGPLVRTLARRRIPPGVTVILVYLGLAGMVALLGSLLIPVIRSEGAYLQTNGAALVQSAITRVKGVPLVAQYLPSTDTLAQTLTARLDTLAGTFVTAAAGIGGAALDLFLVLIFGFFFSVEPGLAQGLVRYLVLPGRQARFLAGLERITQRLSRWVWAQLVLAVYFALVFSLGLSLLGIPFAFSIGTAGGVLEIIPYVGGLVALVLAIVSALTVNPIRILWVILFYLVVVEVESHILAPALYGRFLKIHPVVVLIALIVGAKMGGVVGILFSVPVAVIVVALVQEFHPAADQENALQTNGINEQ